MSTIIGTAGWSIAAESASAFPAEGSSLERYSAVFRRVEINSSFHRSHRASTWQRWAGSVPEDFRFAVKIPKTISHQAKLVDCDALLDAFLTEADALGDRLSVLLLQLPPKLAFDVQVAAPFLERLGRLTHARIACEPRHPSWFEAEPDSLLEALEVARVAADPAVVPAAALPGGWHGLRYWRLHGSPVMYRSAYGPERLAIYEQAIRAETESGRDVWCMFDNTASSAATGDALTLRALLAALDPPPPRS